MFHYGSPKKATINAESTVIYFAWHSLKMKDWVSMRIDVCHIGYCKNEVESGECLSFGAAALTARVFLRPHMRPPRLYVGHKYSSLSPHRLLPTSPQSCFPFTFITLLASAPCPHGACIANQLSRRRSSILSTRSRSVSPHSRLLDRKRLPSSDTTQIKLLEPVPLAAVRGTSMRHSSCVSFWKKQREDTSRIYANNCGAQQTIPTIGAAINIFPFRRTTVGVFSTRALRSFIQSNHFMV